MPQRADSTKKIFILYGRRTGSWRKGSFWLMKIGRDQFGEFATGFILFEFAPERRSGGDRILFLNATHHHAKMRSFDDDCHSQRIQGFFDGMQYLRGKSLLDLQAARIYIHDPGDL